MTAHAILSLSIIICINYIILQQNKGFPKGFPIYSRTVLLLSMMPYLIGGIVVIAHFTFEATADNLLRYGIVYGIGLLCLGYQLVVGYRKNKNLSSILILIAIILVMWGYFGITLHHYEGDHSFYPYGGGHPTPELGEQTRSIIQWISNIILIILSIIYGIIYKKNKTK